MDIPCPLFTSESAAAQVSDLSDGAEVEIERVGGDFHATLKVAESGRRMTLTVHENLLRKKNDA
jgi:hypothetical protein